jgi:hypothetical protein
VHAGLAAALHHARTACATHDPRRAALAPIMQPPAVPRVLLPSPDFDASPLPPGYRWRCATIAARGLLGAAAVCAAASVVAAASALPLLLLGLPALLAAELIFVVVYFHRLKILSVQPIVHEVTGPLCGTRTPCMLLPSPQPTAHARSPQPTPATAHSPRPHHSPPACCSTPRADTAAPQAKPLANLKPNRLRPPQPSNYDPEWTFNKFLGQIKQFDEVQQYLSLWFFGADFSSIRRQNVEEFVAYAFWYRERWAVLLGGSSSSRGQAAARNACTHLPRAFLGGALEGWLHAPGGALPAPAPGPGGPSLSGAALAGPAGSCCWRRARACCWRAWWSGWRTPGASPLRPATPAVRGPAPGGPAQHAARPRLPSARSPAHGCSTGRFTGEGGGLG